MLDRVKEITGKTIAARTKKQKPGSVAIDWIEIRGPFASRRSNGGEISTDADPVAHIFIAEPGKKLPESAAAQKVISAFARRAFRRPVETSEVHRFTALFETAHERGASYEESLRLALSAILVSPQFLYRLELGPGDGEFRLNEYQLASRLSYFLWMSMPDEELFDLAESGKLSDPTTLKQQVRRMLADPRARSFARAFTGQWLGFAALGKSVIPDEKKFPNFDSRLAESMKLETILSFESIVRDDLSVLELLDSKQTWLNADLADHYEIKDVHGDDFQRVTLTDRKRGGLLGMGSVLTATSSPTRTSPVVRGKWILETLLGRRLPEPPADAGELPGDAGEARTLREELLLHRRNPTCATCHDKIDPIGFGLENFDAIGRFRAKQGGKPIDARGELPGGVSFDGPVELKRYLVTERKAEFVRNLTQRLLSFALGRELQYFDEPEIEEIASTVESAEFSSRTLIEQIVLSYPFQYQTGQVPAVE